MTQPEWEKWKGLTRKTWLWHARKPGLERAYDKWGGDARRPADGDSQNKWLNALAEGIGNTSKGPSMEAIKDVIKTKDPYVRLPRGPRQPTKPKESKESKRRVKAATLEESEESEEITDSEESEKLQKQHKSLIYPRRSAKSESPNRPLLLMAPPEHPQETLAPVQLFENFQGLPPVVHRRIWQFAMPNYSRVYLIRPTSDPIFRFIEATGGSVWNHYQAYYQEILKEIANRANIDPEWSVGRKPPKEYLNLCRVSKEVQQHVRALYHRDTKFHVNAIDAADAFNAMGSIFEFLQWLRTETRSFSAEDFLSPTLLSKLATCTRLKFLSLRTYDPFRLKLENEWEKPHVQAFRGIEKVSISVQELRTGGKKKEWIECEDEAAKKIKAAWMRPRLEAIEQEPPKEQPKTHPQEQPTEHPQEPKQTGLELALVSGAKEVAEVPSEDEV